MCGICGIIDSRSGIDESDLKSMVATMDHRGPNSSGHEIFNQENSSVGFGHSRLSIIDLSTAGHQPMNFEHLSITLNGEIYNYKEIKNELGTLGHNFITKTDTEVVLHAYCEWGIECVSKFIGMFAFAVIDKKKKEIKIVRDRAGVKPLYYYYDQGLFMFASELKAFHKHPRFKKNLNMSAVSQYIDYGYVPSPNCIFTNCNKLEPGHYLTYSLKINKYELTKYWDVKDYYSLPRLDISYDNAKSELEKILISSFEYRMVSDVPVGVFLSGGYDSTAVAAILQSRSQKKINTFTIGFEEGNNEAPFAKDITNYLGTNHTEYICKVEVAKEIIPELPFYYDEPFSDSSAIPTILVSKLAKNDVTVALSADAGDEIFAGYTIYDTFLRNKRLTEKIPSFMRQSAGFLIENFLLKITNNNPWLKRRFEVVRELYKNPSFLDQHLYQSYFQLGRTIHNQLLLNKYLDYKSPFDNDYSMISDPLSMAMCIDYKMYLQNDILTKVDRATMSVSLEGREPFLDHRIIEYVAQLPSTYKLGKTKKLILKDIVHKYIPKNMLDRPKTGFSLPINSWLNNDLGYLIDEYLNTDAINESGIFNISYVDRLKEDFKENDRISQDIIWKVLQFQMWYKEWMN
jgi:asparagine synthase (glutamine-hydrolysing)